MTRLKKVYELELGKAISSKQWADVLNILGDLNLIKSEQNIKFLARVKKSKAPIRTIRSYLELERHITFTSHTITVGLLSALIKSKIGVSPSRSTIYRWLGTTSKDQALTPDQVRLVLFKSLNFATKRIDTDARQ